ncbi:hypothetical protein O6H91_04G014300 [Diphasiastrum complanatum]|uniref:Uncharacterized protein n=1 Tax=Diphasiastrum complanatum TaxID=34168 RepID=A0ACC2DUE4_DIPCM|nr:hypothetical protein O6H91_04G014300 [Diphasiastrum complanatum]
MATRDDARQQLWPLSDGARESVVDRITQNLTSMSFFSEQQQQQPQARRIEWSEAAAHAKRIEHAAFLAAQRCVSAANTADDPRGSWRVRIYAQEGGKLLLGVLKAARYGHSDVALSFESEITIRNGDSVKEEVRVSVQKEIFDISGGKRDFLDKARADDLLKPLLAPGASYSSICLSNWSFGKDAAEVAAACIAPIKEKLVEVDLSDIVAGRPEVVALEVMRILSGALEGSDLRSLNLSDNALGEKGVRAFSSILRSQGSLEKLFFINNGISEEAAVAICQLLPSGKNLRTLHFHNNMSGDGGSLALSTLVSSTERLEDFRFSSSRVGKKGAIALAEALKGGKSLKRIDVRDNMFGPEGGIALGNALTQHRWLTDVYLSDLALEDKGAIPVLQALRTAAPSLRILDLGGNEITEKAASYIANCIEKKTFLEKLGLSENELKDGGVVIVSKSLIKGHDSLRELDFSSNDLGRLGALAAAQAVSNKPSFKLLLLDGNHISEQGVDALRVELLKGRNGVEVLGSLEDNEDEEDLEGEDEEAEEVSLSSLDEIEELEAELKGLSV